MRRSKRTAFIGVFMLLEVSFASGANAATPKPTATVNPYGASQQVDPAGPNDTLLTIANHSKVVKLSLNSLRKLGTTQLSLYEPFIKARQTFTVISLAKLFKLVNIPPNATVITDALNDYIYTNAAKNFTDSNGQLAIARFGKDIPYDQGGPIRIVFPDKAALALNLNAWNWSLNVIKVK
jgi:hypothetical protein